MSIIKFLSSLLYKPPVYKFSMDDISKKLGGYQEKLETLGFAVRRTDQTVLFTPAQLLVATRGNIGLEITVDVTGYEGVYYSVETRGLFSPVTLKLADFDNALILVGTREAAAPAESAPPAKEKKIA
jgi:hypothetical protein